MVKKIIFGLTLLCSPVYAEQVDEPIAEQKAKLAAKVTVEMKIIQATTNGNHIDKKIQNLSRHFKDLKYTNFKYLGNKVAEVSDKGSKQFIIEGNRRVRVELKSHNQKKATLKIEIHGAKKNKKLLSTTMIVKRDSTPVIVAVPNKKGGKILLPFSVSY
jgi:hypothetical protein